MGSEHSLSDIFCDRMRNFGRVQKIESPQESGIPDAYYLLSPGLAPLGTALLPRAPGWVEFKHKHEWPKRPDTPFKCDRFTKEQRMWLEDEHRSGGRAWLLLQVGRDYLMFRGDNLRPLFNGMCQTDLVVRADMRTLRANAFPTSRVLKCLTS